MVVAELDVVGIPVAKAEADAPLIVDRDRVLPGAIPSKGVQLIAGRLAKIGDPHRRMNGLELPKGATRNIGRHLLGVSGSEQLLGLPVGEGFDHPAV